MIIDGTIQSEYRNRDKKKSKFSILDLDFHRVILDESHLIKNPSTAVSKACCSVKARNRWCVTGTPIVNSLHDVFGLLKFLKHEPWCESAFWKNAISKAITVTNSNDAREFNNYSNTDVKAEQNNGMKVALDRVRRLLNPLLLRRTKDTVGSDGKSILSLPPIEKKIINVEFTDSERCFYDALLDKSQSAFEGYIAAGTASKSWFAIFSLLQRLRQACDHLSLTVKSQLHNEETTEVSANAPLGNNETSRSKDGSKDRDLRSQPNDEVS